MVDASSTSSGFSVPTLTMQQNPAISAPASASKLGTRNSFSITLNAPTTVPSSHGSSPVTYLQFGQIYGITILDATAHLQPSSRSRYRTTLRVFHEPDGGRLEPQLTPQPRKIRSPLISSDAESSQLPRIEYVPYLEGGSNAHVSPQSIVATAVSDGFSIEWSANEATRGSYCLLQVRFLPASSLRKSPSPLLVSIRAQAERVIFADTPQAFSSGLELCYAVVKLSLEEESGTKFLGDIEHVQHRIENLENLIKQAKLDTNDLCEGRPVSSSSKSPHMPTLPTSDLSIQVTSEHEAVSRYPNIEEIQQKLAGLRAHLSFMRPVTIFRHNASDQATPRVKHDASGKERGSSGCRALQQNLDLGRSNKNFTQQEDLCFYVRECDDINKYYRAIFVRDRNLAALVHGILQKFPQGRDCSVTLTYTNTGWAQVVVTEEIFQQLPNGQHFHVEFVNHGFGSEEQPATQVRRTSFVSSKEPSLQPCSSGSLPLVETMRLDDRPCTEMNLDHFLIDASLYAEYESASDVDLNQIWVANSIEPTTFNPCSLVYGLAEYPWLGPCESSEGTLADWSSFRLSSQPSAETPEDLPMKTENRPVAEAAEVLTSTASPVDSNALSTGMPEFAETGKMEKTGRKPKRSYKRTRDLDSAERSIALDKNRVAAAISRTRKRVREQGQQGELKEKMRENSLLRDTLYGLQAQVDVMARMVAMHKACEV